MGSAVAAACPSSSRPAGNSDAYHRPPAAAEGQTERTDDLQRRNDSRPGAQSVRSAAEPARFGVTAINRGPGPLERSLVLVVDDDDMCRQNVATLLKLADIDVVAVRCCRDAFATVRIRGGDIDLAIVADGFGVEFATGLAGYLSRLPFILTTEFLRAEDHDSVGELGAVAVLGKPIDGDLVVSIVRACAQTRRYRVLNGSSPARRASPSPVTTSSKLPRPLRSAGSMAERFANLMLQAMKSDIDPKTVTRWARLAGVSYSSLSEACRLIRVHPHDARDMARMLRAIVLSKTHDCQFDVFLDVSDRRTLNKLLDRSGLNDNPEGREVTIEAFFKFQRFIANDNEGLRVFWSVLARASSFTG